MEKKLVYKFSSCKEGKFDVVVVFGGDMVIDNFAFTMDELMRSERNMQVTTKGKGRGRRGGRGGKRGGKREKERAVHTACAVCCVLYDVYCMTNAV